MGVPLLDISCALLSSLVCTRPYRQMIGILSGPRQLRRMWNFDADAGGASAGIITAALMIKRDKGFV